MNNFGNRSVAELMARFFSTVLLPFLMPLYALLFLFGNGSMFALTPWGTKMYCYLVTIGVLVLLPLLSIPVFRRFGLVRDYGLNDKQERVYPILVTVAGAFLGFWLLGRVAYAQLVQQLYLVVVIMLSIFSVITLRWKMSMHMAAIGGVCGFLAMLGVKYPGDMRGNLMLMLLLAGCLGASRIYLHKHTPAQVYVGFLYGALFVVGVML